eukprot:2472636-Alexandrium_andersonii.AAC.1
MCDAKLDAEDCLQELGDSSEARLSTLCCTILPLHIIAHVHPLPLVGSPDSRRPGCGVGMSYRGWVGLGSHNCLCSSVAPCVVARLAPASLRTRA